MIVPSLLTLTLTAHFALAAPKLGFSTFDLPPAHHKGPNALGPFLCDTKQIGVPPS